MLSRDLSGFCVERRDDADIRTTPEVRGIGASQPPNFASDLVDAHPPTRRPIAQPSSRSFEPLEPTGRRPVIGPYRAVAQIHSDGPLEIFLCHKQSQLGFVRRAIVKRVLRANGENYFDGRRHLFDEARALGLLEHPGVAGVTEAAEEILRALKERLPASFQRARRFLDLPDFLTFRATGDDTRSLCSTACKWT